MTYSSRTVPMAHQAEAVQRMLPRPAYALLMETGTGKTKPVLDEFGYLEAANEIKDLLVIAPAGCYRNWTCDKGESEDNWSEIRKHLSGDLLDRLRVATWRSGSAQSKRDIESLLQCGDRPRMLCVNVEALSREGGAEAACLEFLSYRGCEVVIDESTTIMHGDSRRTEAVTRIGAAATRRRIMTGLVSPTDPMNLFSQFWFLDWRILGFQTSFGFRARYSILKKAEFKVTTKKGRRVNPIVSVGHRNLNELNRKIAPHSYRVLKKDCMDLPPKTYRIREVEMTGEQRRVYAEMRKYCTTKLDCEAHVTATLVLNQMRVLHQVLCGYVNKDEEGITRLVKSNRTSVLMEELSECDGKFVVWCSYVHNVNEIAGAIEKKFGPGSCAKFWGENLTTRPGEERRFLEDPRCRGMVSTPGSGGMGNNWVVANLVIYYSNLDNLSHRVQSEDRTHRRGQMQPVTYVDLMVPGTVDERFVNSMRKKIDMASAIQGDSYRAWLI